MKQKKEIKFNFYDMRKLLIFGLRSGIITGRIETLETVSKEIGISTSRIGQIENRIVEDMLNAKYE